MMQLPGVKRCEVKRYEVERRARAHYTRPGLRLIDLGATLAVRKLVESLRGQQADAFELEQGVTRA